MPREALKLVVKLHHHMENLKQAARPRREKNQIHSEKQERQS
jgi:hypothetical protein